MDNSFRGERSLLWKQLQVNTIPHVLLFQVIGQVRYGYKPQHVFDAVNNVLLLENWRYEVVSKEIYDNLVVAEVKLFLRVMDECTQPSRQPETGKTVNNNELPKIAGIKYQRRDGIVVAVGNSFDKKELLKSAGFKWDKSGKNWYKEFTVH